MSGIDEKDKNFIKLVNKMNIKITKNTKNEFEKISLNPILFSPQTYKTNKKINFHSNSNNSELEIHQKYLSKDFKVNNSIDANNLYASSNNFNNISYNNKNNIINNNYDSNKIKNNSFNFIQDKVKKYDKINDVKTIVTLIKKESRESLIPVIPHKNYNIIQNNNKNINIDISKKINIDNNNNIFNNKNNLNLTSKNKNIKLEINNDNNIKNVSQTKYNFLKIKIQDTPKKKTSQNNHINDNNLKIRNNEVKKLDKATSVGNFNFKKNKWNNTKKVDINFNPFPEDDKEKDEQNMKIIFNQMKNYLQSDEKILIKDRLIKYGYDSEKIFVNEK